MSKEKIAEAVLNIGYKLAVSPINYLVKFGVIGRVLCFLALIFYTVPILIVFNVIGFTFWIFKK